MTAPKTIEILLADDHQIFREGLKALLEEESNLEVKFQASNGGQVLKLLEDHSVDLVMIDIHMPLMNGIECTQEIRKRYPDLPILALTMVADEVLIKKMLKAGASGYLLKNSGGKELLKAIETVIKGDQYYSSTVGQIIMNSLSNKKSKTISKPPEKLLSSREIDVLKLIVTEYSNSEIAQKLFISPRTVDAHKRNILQKVGAKNIAGLTRYALEHLNLD